MQDDGACTRYHGGHATRHIGRRVRIELACRHQRRTPDGAQGLDQVRIGRGEHAVGIEITQMVVRYDTTAHRFDDGGIGRRESWRKLAFQRDIDIGGGPSGLDLMQTLKDRHALLRCPGMDRIENP